jgi:hypothetical protein
MAKLPQNHREGWSRQEIKALRQLAKENTPTRVIGLKLERTPAAIRNKATREGISLKPVNQSPYGRRS